MKYRYRSDEEMKDSGVEWIGKIPKGVEQERLKYDVKFEKGTNPKNLNINYEGLPYVGASDFGNKNYKIFTTDTNLPICDREDLLILWDGARAGIVDYGHEGVVSSTIVKVKNLSENIYSKYFNWYMKSFEKYFIDMSNGTTIPHMNRKFIENLHIIKFPIDYQKKITNFLDEKTSDFDNIISKKEKLIEKLEEAKKSLISEGVTGKVKVVKNGDDFEIVKREDSEMKDSGVEWIGKIPKDWITSKIKYECDINARIGWKALTASEYVDEGYIFLATPNIKGRNIDFKNVNYITKERYYESPEIMLKENDVLLTKDGSTLGTVNVVRELEREATVNGSIAVLRTKEKLEGIFLNYFIKSNYIQNRIKFFKDGMGVPHLFQSDIKQFDLTVPPYEEEILIGKYLDLKIDKIDSIIDKFKLQIEKLKEAKQALISEAVTGKIEILD